MANEKNKDKKKKKQVTTGSPYSKNDTINNEDEINDDEESFEEIEVTESTNEFQRARTLTKMNSQKLNQEMLKNRLPVFNKSPKKQKTITLNTKKPEYENKIDSLNYIKIDANTTINNTTANKSNTKEVINKKYTFNICLVGDPSVGKTSLVTQFCDNGFKTNSSHTIGIDFRFCDVEYEENKYCTLQLWDTAGQERFKSLTYSYLRKAHGFIFVYDISDKKSFKNINTWLEDVHSCNSIKNFNESKLKLLIGNKKDLRKIDERNKESEFVDEKEGLSIAENNNLLFMETSAKENINVKEAFKLIAKQLVNECSNNIEYEYNLNRGIIEGQRASIALNNSIMIDLPKFEKKKKCSC